MSYAAKPDGTVRGGMSDTYMSYRLPAVADSLVLWETNIIIQCFFLFVEKLNKEKRKERSVLDVNFATSGSSLTQV